MLLPRGLSSRLLLMVQLQLSRPIPDRVLYRRLAGYVVAWLAVYLLNDQIWDWIFYDRLAWSQDSRPVEVAHFFVFDTIKIALLIVGITFLVTFLRSFLTVDRTKALLSGKREGISNVVAAALGVATPFCSCSAVPAFMGFTSAGIPVGITMSFLIASPMVNEIAIALLAAWFGVKIAVLYIAAGLTIAVFSGWVMGRMGAAKWVEPFVTATATSGSGFRVRLEDRINMAREEVIGILRKVWPYLLAGIAVGALLHGWAPKEFFAHFASVDRPYGVLVAVLVGIPLYSNAAGALPIVQALSSQGVPMGTLLAFMMSVVGLSLPELVLLRRVLKPQLLVIFVGVLAAGIIVIGYLFNLLLV